MSERMAVIGRVIAVLLVGLLLAVPGVRAEGFLRVGVLGPRTGAGMAIGRAYEEGISLALETINEKQGGVLGKRLEVLFEDSGGTPERATAALTKLITVDGVVMSVGETQSQCALVEAELAEHYRHPLLVTDALADEITARGSRFVFRAGPANSEIVHDTLMGFIAESGFQRIAMIAEDTEFGRNAAALIQEALKAQGRGALAVPVARGAGDPAAVLASVKEFAPDMILVLCYGWDMPALGTLIQTAGFAKPPPLLFFGPSLAGLWSNPGAGNQAAGHLTLQATRWHLEVDFTEVSAAFRDAYRSKFRKDVSDFHVRSIYDALLIAADALRRAGGGDNEQLVAALEQTQLPVAGGIARFGSELGSYRYHHWQPPLLIVQWQQQQPVVVYPRAVATGDLQR
jgi:branched-chain amino acid transport system substrate-binding protein